MVTAVANREKFRAACPAEFPPPTMKTRPVQRLRSEEHTSELQSHLNLVCRLLLEKKKKTSYAEGHCNILRRRLRCNNSERGRRAGSPSLELCHSPRASRTRARLCSHCESECCVCT